ncbi:MAG TPA: hypothetical protein VK638_18640, partial [Edaphobacter sp.]|nr:hypothetical protein [Edaphobacter sp.]
MSYSRALFQMVRADVLERVRRYSFLLASGFSLYFGYVANAGGVNLQFGLYHGVSNSAWRGCVIGLVASVLLSLIGFYFVNNTIQRDRETRVGRILAATPMSRFQYTLSKALSNFVVLGFMTLMLAAPALFIEIIRKADGPHNIFALLSPILILGLCALSVTASLAVLFETTKALRGGGGNVVYFFLWISLLTIGATAVSSLHSATVSTSFLDYTGLGTMSQQIQAQLHRLDPLFKDGFSFNIGSFPSEKRTFFWAGLNWKVPLIFSRAIWLGLAVGLIVFASTLFDRFDPGCEILGARPFPKEPSAVLSEEERSFVQKTRAKSEQRITFDFDPSSGGRLRPRFSMLVLAELNLLLHGK